MFQVLDSPSIPDSEELDVLEEEYVSLNVEDMKRSKSQRARQRFEPKTDWWQEDETHTVKNDTGRPEDEPNGSPRIEQEGGRPKREGVPRPRAHVAVTGPVKSSSSWCLCRSSLGGATRRPISSESGSSQDGLQSVDPMKEERPSLQPSEHVEKWHARSHGGVTKRCGN